MVIKKSDSNQTGYQAPAVHKAFQLLRTLAESRQHLGMTELAQRLGYSKSTTHGLVHALLREGALTQETNGRKLFLGPTIMDLPFYAWNPMKMTEYAQPTINAIRDQIRETVFLGVLLQMRVLIMATAEADEPLKISASPGTSISLFAGAAAKIFMAGKSDTEIMFLIREKGLPRYTDRSITSEKEYLAEIERVRNQGYAMDDEEYLAGIRAVAVPLNNRMGPPIAVWVVGLSSTMGLKKMHQVVEVASGSIGELRHLLDDQI
jgi:IclR family acetate operon transcriptional repressor